MIEARAIHIQGAVQGVGFRPHAHRLAAEHGLAGEVLNRPAGVQVIVEGDPDEIQRFLERLSREAPPLARIEEVRVEEVPPQDRRGFAIAHSRPGRGSTAVMADAATCPECVRELFDPEDRRYRYPFLNCVDCGPRFTIAEDIPYDRARTTMAGFTMCPECSSEYSDPSNRRFHAQPNACPRCGPQLRLVPSSLLTEEPAEEHGDSALRGAAALLRSGSILAVKGLGGYHLACSALDEGAVSLLRRRKQRDERPFAVMVAGLDEARERGHIDGRTAKLLTDPAAPIVLVPKSEDSLAPSVAPGVDSHGLFLPYTPLHHLLLRECRVPLVMTSGNLTDEPIAYRDEEAFARLAGLADAFLVHDRPIRAPADDSVFRCTGRAAIPVRRSRGYAPLPVRFPAGSPGRTAGPVLAVGADLKNTFCLADGNAAFLSPHVGDLSSPETLAALEEGIAHLSHLLKVKPRAVAHDLHPDYHSTRFARHLADVLGLPALAIQHHEAHVAAVMAEHGCTHPVIGIALDGVGYGTDGRPWGGEIFVGGPGHFERALHLEPFPLPGGDAAAREPWRVALGLLREIAATEHPERDREDEEDRVYRLLDRLPARSSFHGRPWKELLQMIRQGLNTPLTSSAGRLFDAVSALLGFRLVSSYEAHAALLLEAAARRGKDSASAHGDVAVPDPIRTRKGLPGILPVAPLIEDVLSCLDAGLGSEAIAFRFHRMCALMLSSSSARLSSERGLGTVVLGGGVFQNSLLRDLVEADLETRGLQVLAGLEVPPNDAAVSLGQAYIAATRAEPVPYTDANALS